MKRNLVLGCLILTFVTKASITAMQEVTLKFKNNKTMEALLDFAKRFDVVVEKKMPIQKTKRTPKTNQNQLPITHAKHPDVTALAGIWKDREISLDDLRKDAWADRI